nr:GTPase [Argonema galeatum]
MGRTGVGKSSTINSLFNKTIAETNRYRPTTKEVIFYDHGINGVNFTLVDTPGLCDDLPSKGNDRRYIAEIKDKVKRIDSLWFVSCLDDNRLSRDEMEAIKLITEAFGAEVWKRSVIVLTHADKVTKSEYAECLRERSNVIREAIADPECGGSAKKIVDDIYAIAVNNEGNKKRPDGKNWRAELYTQVFLKTSDKGSVLLTLMTHGEIAQRLGLSKKQKQLIRKRFLEALCAYPAAGISVAAVITGGANIPVAVVVAFGGIIGTLCAFLISEIRD